MLTDAIYGVLVFGDATIERSGVDSNLKGTFLQELEAMRDMRDGSYDNFEVAVRAIFKEFLVNNPKTKVGEWVNEVIGHLERKGSPSPMVDDRHLTF